MYVIIVGAGQLGYYLTKDLLSKGLEVTLVDWNFNKVKSLENELGGNVLYASGSSIDGLEKAGTKRADVIVAVTGDDEDNLVICQLGKRYFKVPKAIARINNPKNERIFRELGVGTTISGTSSIAESIEKYLAKKRCKEQSLHLNQIHQLHPILQKLSEFKHILGDNTSSLEFVNIKIPVESSNCNKKLEDINLPAQCVLSLIIRDKEIIFPRPYMKLLPNDTIVAMCSISEKSALEYALLGSSDLYFEKLEEQ